MYGVSRDIHFCYGHRLLNYQGKCANLHGHNARATVELNSAKLDGLGMVRDFYEIKSKLESWIDETLDHKLILCETDPLVSVLKKEGETVVTMPGNPTAEAICRWIFDEAKKRGLPVKRVRLQETENNAAEYSESL